jgi:peptide/nickel transport system substrate-binding protein
MPMLIAPASAQDSGSFILGTTDSIPHLDFADAYEYFSSNTLVQMTHGLYEMPRDGTNAVPVVASGHTVSADGLTYTFTLKSGVMFSDGTEMTADDVIWSLKRAQNLPGDPAFLLGGIDNTSYNKISDTEFSFKLTSKDGTFIQRLTYTNSWIYKEDATVTDTIQAAGYKPIGVGPYYVSDWTIDEQVVLSVNTHYSASVLGTKAPANSEVIIQFFTTSSALKTALESGEVDVAFHSFTPAEITSLEANTDLNTASSPTVGIRYMLINVDAHPDADVRKAMSLAINRTDFVDSIFEGFNDELYSMVPEGFSNSCKEGDACAFPKGPTQSEVATLMEGKGYSATNKYPVELWFDNSGHYGDTEDDVASLLELQLEATGFFDVTLKSTDWATYKTQFGTMPTFLLGWWFDYPDESNYIDPFVGSGAFDLGTNYTSSEMDGYVSTMLESSSATERATAQKSAQELMTTDVPLVPLFTMTKQFVAYGKGITGVVLEPSENMHFDTITTASGAGAPGFEFIAVLLTLGTVLSVRKAFNKRK